MPVGVPRIKSAHEITTADSRIRSRFPFGLIVACFLRADEA
jgi:hypothetical protein